MVYCTQEEIEDATGFGAENFKTRSEAMTEVQWTAFITRVISRMTAKINKYCNVKSFEPHDVTECRDGKGSRDGSYVQRPASINDFIIQNGPGLYPEYQQEFSFLEQPVISVTSVEEDTAPKSSIPTWILRTARGTLAAGDYELVTHKGAAYIQFIANIPIQGYNNIRFIYKAGYPAGSMELDDINDITVRMCAGYLTWKRRLQEYQSVREMGIKDYSQSLSTDMWKEVMTTEIKSDLDRYRQWTFDSSI